MPIIGLSDSQSYDPTRSMQLIAKLKKGSAKENGKMGSDLDHFRFDLQPQFTHYASELESLYGSEPTSFDDVIFIAENPDKAFDTWFEKWGGGQQLKIRCDGQQIHKQLLANHQHSYQMTPCLNNPNNPCGCKQVGRLAFILSKFSMRTGVYGYFMMETHSIYDIGSIFQALNGVSQQFGSIRNVQWILERVPKEINTPKQDRQGNITGRIKTTKHLVNIRPSEASIKQYILPKLQEQQLLPEQVNDTSLLLASSNDESDIDLGDDESEEITITENMANFTTILQTIIPDVTVVDVGEAFADVVYDDLDTASKVAIFSLYWCAGIKEDTVACAKAIANSNNRIVLEDVMVEIEGLLSDG